jgi:hypothetical protein
MQARLLFSMGSSNHWPDSGSAGSNGSATESIASPRRDIAGDWVQRTEELEYTASQARRADVPRRLIKRSGVS